MKYEIDDAANERAAQFWATAIRAATVMSWQIIVMLGIIIAAFAGQTSGSQSPAQIRYASMVIDIATIAWLLSLVGHASLLCIGWGKVHQIFTAPNRAWFFREALRRPVLKLLPFVCGHVALAGLFVVGLSYPIAMTSGLVITVRRALPAINHDLRCDAELMLKLQNKLYRVAEPCEGSVKARIEEEGQVDHAATQPNAVPTEK